MGSSNKRIFNVLLIWNAIEMFNIIDYWNIIVCFHEQIILVIIMSILFIEPFYGQTISPIL